MDEIIEVLIESIRIKRRVRKETGDLVPLMHSLRKHGQLTPIILNTRNELIAGFRRLESAKRLGWSSIKAVVLERDSEVQMLELELEENIQRKELSPDEISNGIGRLGHLRNPGCLSKIFKGMGHFFRRRP